MYEHISSPVRAAQPYRTSLVLRFVIGRFAYVRLIR